MPSFTYRELIKKLKKKGFYFFREAKGSHEVWNHDELGLLFIPKHGSKNIATGTVNQIIKQAGFKNIQDFQKFR